MAGAYDVTVSAGSLRPDDATITFAHRWTEAGVAVEAAFTGAHLLHLAAAGCVLNDLYREAGALGVDLAGVRVVAGGDFDTDSWASSGITYAVTLDTGASDAAQRDLLDRVDAVAEIPRALRAGTTVSRSAGPPGA